MKKNSPVKNPPDKSSPPPPAALLRTTVFSGLMLVVLLGVLLVVIYLTGRVISAEQENRFHRLLVEYDYKYRQTVESGQHTVLRQELDSLDHELGRLEKRAEGVESWLSILKRRRRLAQIDSLYRHSYLQSSRQAALAFPHSAPIAAVAAAALVHEAAITSEGEKQLRSMLKLFSDSRYDSIRLSLHILLGDFRNPLTACAAMLEETDYPLDLPHDIAGWENSQAILTDMAILKILAGDIPGAAVNIQAALGAFPSPQFIRLAAEYFYDFGDLLRSAELFSMLRDEAALSRQADALWLAGYAGSARNIWSMLVPAAALDGGTEETAAKAGAVASVDVASVDALYNRALYNLALTAPEREEAIPLFERLTMRPHDPCRDFGLIRYSRLLDAPQAAAVLNGEREAAGRRSADPLNTLIDLEILKRRSETEEVGRIVAETWMLLERYPKAEDLYRWGAWYFDLQRHYDECDILLKTAAKHNFAGQWLAVHSALSHIRVGNAEGAEGALVPIMGENAPWEADANLGRILEGRRALVRAVANYEKAFDSLMESAPLPDGHQDIASRIQFRIAHCLNSLGRPEDSRRALEYALELNPDNLRARLELGRL